MRGAIPLNNMRLLKEVGLHLALRAPDWSPVAEKPTSTRSGRRCAWQTAGPGRGAAGAACRLWSTPLPCPSRPSSSGPWRWASVGRLGPVPSRVGSSIDPEELLASPGEWVSAWGLKLLIVDASAAGQDEVEALVRLLHSLPTEWLVYTVLFLSAKENWDGSGEAANGR